MEKIIKAAVDKIRNWHQGISRKQNLVFFNPTYDGIGTMTRGCPHFQCFVSNIKCQALVENYSRQNQIHIVHPHRTDFGLLKAFTPPVVKQLTTSFMRDHPRLWKKAGTGRVISMKMRVDHISNRYTQTTLNELPYLLRFVRKDERVE